MARCGCESATECGCSFAGSGSVAVSGSGSPADPFVASVASPASIDKLATESVTSSIVLQDDDELFLPLPITSRWAFEAGILYDGATAGDILCQFTGPAGALGWYEGIGLDDGGAAATDLKMQVASVLDGSTSMSFGALGAGVNAALSMKGFITVAGTAGNLRFRWAQRASSATATRVLLRSFLTATRVA